MNESQRIDRIRRGLNEVENDLVDELCSGRIDRREFLRHGTVLGISAPLLLAVLGDAIAPRTARAAMGGTLRIAQITPTGAIDPVTVPDTGSVIMLCQTGEYLVLSAGDLSLRPVLAESWKPDATGAVWTFALRKGVKFHNGKVMTADDVVATMDRLADPKNASNALSAFQGALSKGGTRKIDDSTVEFHLDAPNGNFPYYVSSDNYNTIILPADYAGDFEKNFIGTGPFKLEKYTPKVGATFVRNPDYWGPKALPERTEFSFYADMQPQILALQARQVDVVAQVTAGEGVALLSDPSVSIISLRSSAHTQVHMRTDMAPFTDKRVRRAIALCLDRKKLVAGLFHGRSDIGNDSPFAPVFPSTDRSVGQRARDIPQAKQLMADAGFADGFKIKLTSERFIEIPNYCQVIQQAVRDIGITIDLNLETQDAYYGKAVFGQSDWLDSIFGATDYGHRGVPNVLLAAPLTSDGTWNSAHFKNKEYDSLVASYVAALDLGSQRAMAGQIQRLLLDETPVIFSYFYNYLSATKRGVTGVETTAMGHVFLDRGVFANAG
jgi:peptide/nickel transport system substrate-binding protein